MVGKVFSHYKILEKLGEGGMGVVYKAQDTKLSRTVALKFLPSGLHAHEPERARFLQEAQSASLLNHPNICTIHDIVEEGDLQAIVMELVEGKTLRTVLGESGSPEGAEGLRLMDAVAYATQIGEALQEAHAKGVVHRDVKPENIMVNEKNQIKVMDFGLAKLKGSLALTRTSSTIGTLAYMSPEQIEGHPVDARSDIFSFGIVLYEMLSGGHPPFRAEHEAALMYSIVNEEPAPIQSYRQGISSELTHILNRALEKDPDDRYQSASDMVIDLRRVKKHSTKVVLGGPLRQEAAPEEDRIAPPSTERDQRGHLPASGPRSFWKEHSSLGLGLAVLALVALGISLLQFLNPPDALRGVPQQATFRRLTDRPDVESFPDISPDGNFIVYTQEFPDHSSIFLQRVGGGNPINLTGDSQSFNTQARFSPDGQSIAFWSDRGGGGIFLMGSTGESVRRLTDFGHNPTWSPDGEEILCASHFIFHPQGRTGVSQLWSVEVRTGMRRLIDSGDAVQPDWSPHGHRIAFWALPPGGGDRDIWTIPASGGDPVWVTHDAYVDWNPVWSPDGRYLFFSSDRGGSMNLWRVRIDEESGRVLGECEPLTTPSPWSGHLRLSRDGRRIVYSSMESKSNIQKVVFDPVSERLIGIPMPVTQGAKEIYQIDPSPDGQYLAYAVSEEQEDVFVIRTDGSDLRQLTNDIYKDRRPRWSPDGKRIAFYSNRSGRYQVWSVNPDGSGLSQLATAPAGGSMNYTEWLGDGMHIAYFEQARGTSILDLHPPLGERKPESIASISNGDTIFYLSASSLDGKLLSGNLVSRTTAEGPPGIVVYSLESKTYVPVADSGYATAWLNDSRRILVLRNRGIWIVDARSRKSHEILTPPPGTSVVDARPSMDNRTLYFTLGSGEGDIWLATMK